MQSYEYTIAVICDERASLTPGSFVNASSEHEKHAQKASGSWFASIKVALSTLKISLGTTVSCR